MFARAVYRRGAMTLQALSEKIGDAPFFEILRTWAAGHKYGTATTEECDSRARTYAFALIG